MNHILYSIFLLLFFAITNAFGQTRIFNTPMESLGFVMHDDDSIISSRYFRLYLDEEKYALESHYGVVFSYDNHHNVNDSTFLSFGTYAIQNNEIQMKDSLNKFSMKAFVDEKNNIRFSCGLSGVLEKGFALCEVTEQRITDIINPIIFNYQLDTELYCNNEEIIKLKFGFYESNFKKLNLSDDGRYEFFMQFPNDIISIGKWWREGDLIAFMDDRLDKPFYAVIDNRLKGKIVIPTMPSVLYNNKIVDKTFFFTGYDASVPFDDSLTKPLSRKASLNESFQSKNKNGVITISFYDDEYFIKLTRVDYDNFDAIVFIHTISYGKYTKENSVLHLRDNLNSCQMSFELSPDTCVITMTEGYCPWKDTSFYFVKKTWDSSDFSYLSDTEEAVDPSESYHPQDTLYPLPIGNYRFLVDGNYLHNLALNEDGSFSFSIWNILLLKGMWHRSGNILFLYDDCIQQPFYVMVYQDGIVPYLPGLFGKEKAAAPTRP